MSEQKATSHGSADSIRGEYERHGATKFYEQFGGDYRNPHEPVIARCLELAVKNWCLNLDAVLDLAAGSGEATLVLRSLGAKRIDGIDPYTAKAYLSRTGAVAEQFTFADISAGALSGRRYSMIVCSFALHLCEESRLPALAYQLSRISDSLLVVTPHKRPVIRAEWGWELIGENRTERARSRYYNLNRL